MKSRRFYWLLNLTVWVAVFIALKGCGGASP